MSPTLGALFLFLGIIILWLALKGRIPDTWRALFTGEVQS